MNKITDKPVAEMTTDEIGQVYVGRLLAEGTQAIEQGNTVPADADFFDQLRQHVRLLSAHTS